ncbi:MAG: hypothetical protein M1510_11590 [Nitrospirae bacterium]|nr:hypothetical protein [Nitrospirota bacterium]
MPKKQEKKAAKKEPKKKAAPAKTQNPDAERNALTVKIEGDLPYNRQVYVNEVRFLLKQTAQTIIEIGKRLLVIQERERGQFRDVVENEIGIPKTSAYRFMNAALKAEKFPAINVSQIGTSASKVYALFEAPEEELEKLAQLGLFAGKDEDELAAMSHKELRELVRDLKTNTDQIVEEKTTALRNQNDLLRQEIYEFHKIIPASQKDVSKGEKQLMYAQAKYDEFEAALSALAFNAMEIDDIKIGAKVEGLLKTCHARLIHLAEKWDAHKRGDIQK